SIAEYAAPIRERNKGNADLGIYVQDQWRGIPRVTLNLGLRFDYFNAEAPAQSAPAGYFVGARDFAPVKDVPNWKNFNPRLCATWDVLGNGRTALKVSLGRYNGPLGTGMATVADG